MLSNLEQEADIQAIDRRRRAQLSGEIEGPARRARRAVAEALNEKGRE
jgi:hypothetical protein